MSKAKANLEIPQKVVDCTYTVTKEEIKQFYVRSNLPSVIAWAVVIIVACVVTGFTIYGVFILLFALGYLALFLVQVGRAYRHTMKDKGLFLAAHVSMTETDVRFSTEEREGTRFPWIALSGIATTTTMYVFRLTAQGTVLIPKRVFSGEEQHWLNDYVIPTVKRRKQMKDEKN